MFFFINHSKNFITMTEKDAKKNISNALCKTIRENIWSICDNIELVDYIHCNENGREKIKMLIEQQYYYCSESDAMWFYI